MKYVYALPILILVLLPVIAHADIPFAARAEFSIPGLEALPRAAWDVQHWMNDSTYGWACMHGDTILYATTVGDSIRRYLLQYDPYGCAITHTRLRVLRIPAQPTHAYAFVQSLHQWCGDGDSWIFCLLIDLTTSQVVHSFSLVASSSQDWGQLYSSSSGSIGDLLLWPPSPQPCARIYFTYLTSVYTDHDFGTWERQTSGSAGRLYSDSLTATSSPYAVTSAVSVSPFARANPLRLALGGHSWESEYSWRWDCDTCDTWSTYDSNWVNSIVPGTTLAPRNVTSGMRSVQAQQDEDLTQRLICFSDSGVWALDPVSYDTLWRSAPLGGALYTAQLTGSGDERLMAYDSTTRSFAVYDAGSGEPVEQTSSLPDTLRYLIKRPGHPTEFVVRSGGTIRVLGPMGPAPAQLTCQWREETGMVRLRWSAVMGATGYRIFSASVLDGTLTLEGTVPAGTLTFDLSPNTLRRYYYVTAEYQVR